MSFLAIGLMVIVMCVFICLSIELKKALRKLSLNPLKMNQEKKFWYIQALRSSRKEE